MNKNFFRNSRYYRWLLVAYIKKHFLFIIIGIILGSFLGIKAKYLYFFFRPEIKIERIGIIGNYTQKNLPQDIQNLISYGLTSVSSNWKVIPKVAKKYEIKEQGKVYLFYLDQNYRWHDNNQKITTNDINYTFKDVKIKRYNEFIIEFTLAEPFSAFPSLVSQPLFKKGLIGLGEYKISRIEWEGKFISKLILDKKSKKIIFKFYPREKDALTGYNLGEINSVWGLTDKQKILALKKTQIFEFPDYHKYIGIFLNLRVGILGEKNFRLALNYALLDKEIKEKRAYSPINPNSWAYNPNIKKYEYNLLSAQKLLAKMREDNPKIKFKITLSAIRPYDKYAQTIADSWKKIGVDAKLEIISVPPARFEALLAAQEIPIDPDQYPLWHSTSKLNITGYDSKRIDKLLEDGRTIIDEQDRKEKYLEFQKYLVEDSPVIFLYFPANYTIARL